ncbi:MAG: hypothetical protein ACRD3S_08085 [Terracidiphilus sp.]
MNRPIRNPQTRANPNLETLPQSAAATSRVIRRLQDAVYREMYRLEDRQPGSEMGLALALLRVIVASQRFTMREDIEIWLREICPVALKMIENSLECCNQSPVSWR